MITSFAKITSESFGFLESAFNFRCVNFSETIVRWESSAVFVEVWYDAHRSYEVGLDIGQLRTGSAQIGPPYSLGEVLGVAGFKLTDRPFFQTSSEEKLKQALEQMARLLIQHGTK